jgi:prevent-host-death family protein
MKLVPISELKAHLSEHLRAVEAGEIIEVLNLARAVARLVPLEKNDGVELVAPVRPFASVRALRIAAGKSTMRSAEALRRERGRR